MFSVVIVYIKNSVGLCIYEYKSSASFLSASVAFLYSSSLAKKSLGLILPITYSFISKIALERDGLASTAFSIIE